MNRLMRIRPHHVVLAIVLVYGPLYIADFLCGYCISSLPPYWPFQ